MQPGSRQTKKKKKQKRHVNRDEDKDENENELENEEALITIGVTANESEKTVREVPSKTTKAGLLL